MYRREFARQMALLLAGSLTSACAPLSRGASSPAPASASKSAPTSVLSGGLRLTIVHTNDSNGYVEPCG